MIVQYRSFFAASVLLFALLFTGCGENYPLSGKVTYSDDGSPVPTGAIFFTDGKFMSQGAIKEDGTYVVGTLKKTDGIPPGAYKVYFGGVQRQEDVKNAEGILETKYIPLIDGKYNSANTSGLTFTADGSEKTFDVKLDRATAPK